MPMRTKSAIPPARRLHLLQQLACVLGAAFLATSSARAAVIIGFDPLVKGGAGQDKSLGEAWGFYIPFAFDVGGPYTITSVQLLIVNTVSLPNISLIVTSTLGADTSMPTALMSLSSPGSVSETQLCTFDADSSAILTSGSTYYLRLGYVRVTNEDPQWVSVEKPPSGSGPASGNHGNPNTSGSPTGGDGPPPAVTLTPLMTLNPANPLTYRRIHFDSTYDDLSGYYGISITAIAVPEPTTFAMTVGGLTLGAALFSRLRRRR